MAVHAWSAFFFSVKAMMMATGTELTAKKPAAATASSSGWDLRVEVSASEVYSRRVALTARAMLEKLNRTRGKLSLLPARGRDWTMVEMQPMSMASGVLNPATATRMKGRFMDMVPVMPGIFTR